MTKPLTDQLFEEILRARTRVYRAGSVTPQQEILSPGNYKILVKREDLGPINAYKWRGAYNAVSVYVEQTQCQTVVAASAGNHAQGVALAAKKLGLNAKIFMPLSAPQMKQQSVKRHGGAAVEIILIGDTYNEAAEAAQTYAAQHALTCIHPFDDIYTMAGQATIADEIVLSGTIPDIVFLQIGGGGLAAAVSCWLKKHHPHIKIIGVEGIDQASMMASIKAGKPVTLDKVDTFCDGTAVTRPGDLTFQICQQYIDDYITVTNEEVSAAIQRMWEASRIIPEPSGAMGLAGLIQYAETHATEVSGKTLLCICCGANMDFGKLATISQKSAIGAHRRRYLQFHLQEKRGGLLDLLDKHFGDLTVSEFLYGKTHENAAWPIIALEAEPARMAHLDEELTRAGVEFADVTFDADVQYRVINYNPALFKNPLLLLIEFPERKGALRDFMRKVSQVSNVCYFNYTYSGEAVGRSLMGFEFESQTAHAGFLKLIHDTPVSVFPVDPATTKRILQH
jgi:threonine dehydratase